jgi:hypothetical protein
MLASLGGALALLLGLAVLILPLLTPELSRPRDALWGAVVLLLGLVLVTSADRLTGAPMLGVLCGGLLIGRLGLEVAQARWFRLLPEERQQLWSAKRWQGAWAQLSQASAKLLALGSQALAGLGAWISERRQPRSGKRWVRPEQSGSETGPKPGAEPKQVAEPEPVAETAAEPAAETSAEPVAEPSAEPQAEPQPERAPNRDAALDAQLEDAPEVAPAAAPEAPPAEAPETDLETAPAAAPETAATAVPAALGAECLAAPEPEPTTWINSLAELDHLLDQAEQTPAMAGATNRAPADSDDAAALAEPAAAGANAAAKPPEHPAAGDQAG